jgi:hypothetical protein
LSKVTEPYSLRCTWFWLSGAFTVIDRKLRHTDSRCGLPEPQLQFLLCCPLDCTSPRAEQGTCLLPTPDSTSFPEAPLCAGHSAILCTWQCHLTLVGEGNRAGLTGEGDTRGAGQGHRAWRGTASQKCSQQGGVWPVGLAGRSALFCGGGMCSVC